MYIAKYSQSDSGTDDEDWNRGKAKYESLSVEELRKYEGNWIGVSKDGVVASRPQKERRRFGGDVEDLGILLLGCMSRWF